MILHIVRSGETLKKIADNYQCEISDITSNNFHITDFKNLKPGMKIKVPFLSKPIIEVLEETESFISDYYPSLTEKFNEDNIKKEEFKEEIQVKTDSVIEIKKNENSTVTKQEIRYNGTYCGNVIPPIPEIYIKKI